MSDYTFFTSCILRSPAFSFSGYSLNKIKDVLKDKYFQNALLIGSSSLYRQLEKVDFEYAKLSEREKSSVKKYYNRICFRPTPFGAFSNFSALNWGDGEAIVIRKQNIHLAKSFSEKIKVVQGLRDSTRKGLIKYTANQTIYECGEELRFIVPALEKNSSGFEFSIQSVNYLPALKSIALYCGQEKSYVQILDFLKANEQIDTPIAVTLLDELIALQFLMDEYVPNITGQDYLEKAVTQNPSVKMPGKDKSKVLAIPVNKISARNHQILKEAITESRDVYVNSEGILGGSLDIKYQEPILRALECLELFNTNDDGALLAFKGLYEKKFGRQALPLLYVLDPETGIGYQNLTENWEKESLLQDVKWDESPIKKASAQWSPVHEFLLNKWHEASRSLQRKNIITLLESDLPKLRKITKNTSQAQTISVLFRITEGKIWIENAGGASANSLIGRFTPFNEQISKLSEFVAEKENMANPDVIFAEISHVCDLHSANINSRLNPYAYEIPILNVTGAANRFQIPLNDLWVTAVDSQIMLYSKKLHKRIIPRLSSAFNYTRSNLAVFKFLCDLQYQGIKPGLQLCLSHYFPGLGYYPRVEFADIILSPASWHLEKKDFEFLYKASEAQRIKLFKNFAAKLGLPSYIALSSHDHQLVFNLKEKGELLFLFEAIKNQNDITFKEFLLPPGNNNLAANRQGPVVNQFIASLYHEKQLYCGVVLPLAESTIPSRKLAPGSEWLYFKIYCHPIRANELLSSDIYALLDNMNRQNLLSGWFFIRYNDPEYHIRLRLKVKSGEFEKTLNMASTCLNLLTGAEKVNSYDIAIYERELERYGFEKIHDFEQIFFKSSTYILSYLALAGEEQQLMEYYTFAIFTVRNIMAIFNIIDSQRIQFLEQMVSSFLTEFNNTPDLKYQLDLKFRKLKPVLESGLPQVPGKLGLLKLNLAHQGYMETLRRFFYKSTSEPRDRMIKWMADVIHMHLNRLFTEDARRQELVLYYALLKFEKGSHAKIVNERVKFTT